MKAKDERLKMEVELLKRLGTSCICHMPTTPATES